MKRTLAILTLIIAIVLGIGAAPAYALTYPQVILADSPVHYYRLNEASGATAADLAYGSPANYVNSPTYSQAGAIYDGDKAIGATLAQINTGITLTGYGAVNHTIGCEVWFKLYSTGAAVNAVRYLCIIVAGSENMWMHIGVNSLGVPQLNLIHTSNLTLATAVTFNVWHHAYMQYDNTLHTLSLYYDGSLVLSASDTAFTTANATVRWATGAGNLQIDIDEAALYEHALTADQIKFHYDNGFSAISTPTPTASGTPIYTYTPSITPTPTDTPTPTPPSEYPITVGSYQGSLVLSATAGDTLLGALLAMLLVGILFQIGLNLLKWRRQ